MTAIMEAPVAGADLDSAAYTAASASATTEVADGARLSVLIVDDDRALREGCVSVLQNDGYTVVAEGRSDAALELVRRRPFDVVLLNLFARPVSGMDILRAIRELSRDTLVVIMTSEPSVQTNVEALDAGAWEYVPKPFSATHLRVLMGRAAHTVKQRRQQAADRQEVADTVDGAPTHGVLGISQSFRRTLALARKVASTDASVMLIGESGTGKEMIARFIHANSRRAKHTLMPVNCAALPEALLESEMFGHRRGAFTGADRDKPGLLETAHQGTLFLDELTEMSHPIQAKLLRVLQDGRLRRVGSEEEEGRAVDVRLITATNQDPEQAVRAGILRQDLFFRLWVFPIRLPALRERPDDVVYLAKHFFSMYWTRHRSTRAKQPILGDELLDELARRTWPGNVRELQNAMERLAVSAEPGQTIGPADLPPGNDVESNGRGMTTPAAATLLSTTFHEAKEQFVADFEKTYLTHLAQRAGRNLSRAARLASIDRTTLYRLLEKHNLHRRDFVDAEN
ncbi:MAG TPA: sigma-54 dependent transcriptional regulator [Gemmatimonadaceae bacterium]